MVTALDSVCEQIVPHYVLQGVGPVAEKDPLLGVLDVLCLILPRKDLDP